jgi:anaerobic selenocysteine-containing dehydrogenase
MTRVPTRRVKLTRRDALKLASVGGVVAVGAGLGVADVARGREEVVAGTCRFCTMHCGFLATVKGDTVVDVKGDPASNTRGFLCEHGKALPDVIHSKERLRRPLKREGDAFVEVS